MVLTVASNLIYFLVSCCTKPHPDQKRFGGLPNPSIFLTNLGCVKDHIPLTRPKYKVNHFLSHFLPPTGNPKLTGWSLKQSCKSLFLEPFGIISDPFGDRCIFPFSDPLQVGLPGWALIWFLSPCESFFFSTQGLSKPFFLGLVIGPVGRVFSQHLLNNLQGHIGSPVGQIGLG